MKNDKHEQNELQRMMEGRAARMIAAAVTVFLCVLTLFEFVALKMEWNVPALAVLSGDNGLWTREYQREELVMDGSTETFCSQTMERHRLQEAVRMPKRMRRKMAAAGWCRPVRMQGTGKTCRWKGQKRCGRMRLRRRM